MNLQTVLTGRARNEINRKAINKLKSGVFSAVCYGFLIVLAFVFFSPFLYMLTTSLKSYSDLHNVSITWIPSGFNFENYVTAAKAMSLKTTVVNSVIVTLLATVGHLISCSFIGYGFARFQFPFKKILFFGVILSAAIPIQTFIIPMYVTYSKLNMLDSFWPLIVPNLFGFGLRGGIFVFLFRQYFYLFPTALEEAAHLDGCGRIRSFFRIALPSAGSTIVVTTVLSMVWHWNDYYEPSLYLTGGTKTALVTQMLPKLYEILSSGAGESGLDTLEMMTRYHEGVVMAATAMAILPLLIAYLILQRRFMASIVKTGLVG